MNTNTVDYQSEYFKDDRTECVWKVVMKNNLSGEGTSFDPRNLTLSSYRCLLCDGYACDCLSYSA